MIGSHGAARTVRDTGRSHNFSPRCGPQPPAQLEDLQRQLTNVRKANAREKQANIDDGSELRRVDKLCAKLRRDNAQMREQLESHSGELDQAQRLQNMSTDLQQRLEQQEEENELLQQLHARQASQLKEEGFSAIQRGEAEKLKHHNAELQQQVRAIAHPRHSCGRQYSRACRPALSPVRVTCCGHNAP